MTIGKSITLKKSRLSAAMLAAMLMPAAASVLAQDTTEDSQEQTQEQKATNLDKIVVTGSLIPQTELETVTPVIIITAEDIHSRGFTSVADVLRSNSFSSGGVQGGETPNSFTQGAEAVSMFGLDPGYTKYLINGRPMSNYPALYNGSDVFTNISGIPIDSIDRIEILPGGSSSLYGSDALAGVVNFILKKSYDGTSLRIRGGGYSEGGGSTARFSLTTGLHGLNDRLNGVFSVQYETGDPIWGYQRDLTDSTNSNGYDAQRASFDYLAYGYVGIATNGFSDYTFIFPDAAEDCANTTSQQNGTTGMSYSASYGGYYCGSNYSSGNETIKNGKDSGQISTHVTFDVTDNFTLYGDLLYSHEVTKYTWGGTWWGTSVKYGYYYDPDYDALLNLQRVFSPEDIGGEGFADIMNKNTTDSYTFTLGGQGSLGKWNYDASFTRNETKYTSRNFALWADAINSYFDETVMGEQLGWDPYFGVYPVFQPDYAAFYSADLTSEEFASFSGYTTARAKTWDNLFRTQVTNTELFSLPAGSAGFAAALEAGNEGWDYTPDARMVAELGETTSEVWGSTDVSGAGHRTRYALMSELRMPLFKTLTASLSARYDAYDAYGNKIDKPTWSAGLEFRPIQSLLFRGKYGTAFKAPTLSDMYQGLSGYYAYATDYYRCGEQGYAPADVADCSYDSVQYFGQQSGNEDLEPINAKVWNVGTVWAPAPNLSFSVDYFKWEIDNEVAQLSANQVLLQEYYCRNGEAGPGLTSCDNALSWVTRGESGALQSVYTPKVNIAKQWLEVMTVSGKYMLDIGRWGELMLSANYTKTFKHELQTSSTEEVIDLLNDPTNNWVYDAGPNNKTDASAGWHLGKWTTTAYVNRLGSTPNYQAYLSGDYDSVNSAGAAAGKWGPYITYNLGVEYQALDNLKLSLQINNLTNKTPEYQTSNYSGGSTTPYNNYLYSTYGRSIYAELRYDFGGESGG